MPNGEFLAVQPHFWTVPLVFLVLLLVTLWCLRVLIRKYREEGYTSREDVVMESWQSIPMLIFGIAAIITGIVSVVQAIPYNPQYWAYYSVEGTVDDYTNRLDDGSGSFTGVPILTLEGSNVRYVSQDSRLATLIGEEVQLRCAIAWRPYGSDVYTCALGPGANN